MPVSDLDSDLSYERQHLVRSRAALKQMRELAEALYSTGERVAGDAYTAEQLGRHMARRVRELADDPNTPLFFGRLDLASGNRTDANRFHIGRRHVTDAAGEPMVLDWRAPISRSFYQASAKDPQGVRTRRRFGFMRGDLTSFEDEHLNRGEELGINSRILTSEIERPRVGPMRDIVATIQPEQDELVRADLAETICVQGAPGTGKTAVGLHRAAFLLFTYRERLKRSGVLIVGPNSAFLHYIASVLPALGELDVHHSTVDALVETVTIKAEDTPEAAKVKHDARMATVLATALWGRIGKPTEPLTVPDDSYRWRIATEPLRRIVDGVRSENPAYGIGRERVRARVVALLQRQSENRRGDSPSDAWLRRMGKSKPVTAFVDQVWPAVTGPELVAELLTDPRTAGELTTGEQEAIRWAKPPKTHKSARWTAADAVLVDEANGLIDRPSSFGHVVVDEAQDLSAMQCRAIARRSEHGSLTVLGDLAQATAPWAAATWTASLEHLGKPQGRVVPLTTGFRVPAAVLVLANRLLPALDVDVPPAVSLRGDGELRIETDPDVAGATIAAVRRALTIEGSVGVIAPDAAVAGLRTALAEAAVETASATADLSPKEATATTDLSPKEATRVTVLPATVAKGLEYDHVIVVEPADIVAAEARGLNRLYVVLTRAVSRLDIVHAKPLPPQLSATLSG